jgi:hypothetical protein
MGGRTVKKNAKMRRFITIRGIFTLFFGKIPNMGRYDAF